MTPPPLDPRLARLALLTRLLDQVFRVPGTRWRFGLEAIFGLVPGLGDTIGALLGSYGVLLARELGAPASVQLRMLVNLGVDALAGAIPVLGDVFDFVFKAHVRNQQLLHDWLATPHATRRSSALLLVVGLAVLLGVLIGAVWIAIWSMRALFGLITPA